MIYIFSAFDKLRVYELKSDPVGTWKCNFPPFMTEQKKDMRGHEESYISMKDGKDRLA